jgi:hypothetical protein
MAQFVYIYNSGPFVAKFALGLPGGGQTPWSGEKGPSGYANWDLEALGVAEGEEVCAICDIEGGTGPHMSGANVTASYDGSTCDYSCTGTPFTPIFSSCD